FERAGYRAICTPVLTFAFPNQRRLRGHLERVEEYGALVATSPRVATALSELFGEQSGLADEWRGAPAYAVGPKTARCLRKFGLRPRGDDAGSAAALAERIVAEKPSVPLLFLCGNRRRDTLPHRLREAGIPFDEVVVYETRTREALTLPPSEGSTWLVFFSPSGLEAIEQSESVTPADYRRAAIGPTTAGALREAGWSVDAVAEEPSPEGLISALPGADEAE
ncbi:MAG: uroporphyrinogen-III synthase, partial [Salinibacter sp.]